MKYTSTIFVDFLKKLIIFDKECKSVLDVSSRMIHERYMGEKNEWDSIRTRLDQNTKTYMAKNRELLSDYQRKIHGILLHDLEAKRGVFTRLQKCKEILTLIVSVENSVRSKTEYDASKKSQNHHIAITADELISGVVDFTALANGVNIAIRSRKIKDITLRSSQLYCLCRYAEQVMNQEIVTLRAVIGENRDALHDNYANVSADSHHNITSEWNSAMSYFDEISGNFVSQKNKSADETLRVSSSSADICHNRLDKLINNFCGQFPPKQFADEYIRIYSLEPLYDQYECTKEMPRNVYISKFEYEVLPLGLCDFTKKFLSKYYYYIYTGDKLCFPNCAEFGAEFNYLFKFSGEGRSNVIKDACDIGMRLFMMLPPGKVNFTFIDPVTLGESFATFTRLVDVDDRTSEVINGKIWSSSADIEDKLKIMTDHISNVTQRYLQGKYDNIFEYNQMAEQNAEAYQVIMLMDYPAGLNELSLKLLEQIATSGPKCGVFTVIYRNESQYRKVSERSYPLISNIEASFQEFNYSEDAKIITCNNGTVKNQQFLWKGIIMPSIERMDKIIATLKKGIKSADKVVIGIEKVNDAESIETTKDGIRIPIGIRGANEVQYLTLGVGGSHHALIAGVAGSGKSSLLHTIILKTLTQYSPEELSIYLVDFKRGVEFKIYADFVLPSFKVVAIESEREFGYNILIALEREQKIRADLFKKSHVDKIEEYRDLGKKMPRILVIMDEFHELFSNANDEFAKKSAVIMERIVRQGRAFGVHLILASQSYSNITGVDRAVFDQMAVRIVLKCSKTDANLLLDSGSSEIDQISIDDPGRAVYNSEAGNKEYNSHFRVAYINPEKHRKMLQEISNSTKKFANYKQPTRILLSNIEDNNYSIFNQFVSYDAANYNTLGKLYIGEALGVSSNMPMDFGRTEYSNLLMIGEDTEKVRSMFDFAILSLCINYWIVNRKVPEQPFIYLFNCKPLEDSYFKDTLKLLAEFLPEYVKYIACGESSEVQSVISGLYHNITDGSVLHDTDNYFFVFGYQRAEELKYETKLTQSEDIDQFFNMAPSIESRTKPSPKDMFRTIVKNGAQKGVHSILWQDSFNALYQDDKDMMSYFSMRVAFNMSPDEYSRFVSENDVTLMSENNAIYYNRARDNQKFRPYQAPDEEWLKDISEKLK